MTIRRTRTTVLLETVKLSDSFLWQYKQAIQANHSRAFGFPYTYVRLNFHSHDASSSSSSNSSSEYSMDTVKGTLFRLNCSSSQEHVYATFNKKWNDECDEINRKLHAITRQAILDHCPHLLDLPLGSFSVGNR